MATVIPGTAFTFVWHRDVELGQTYISMHCTGDLFEWRVAVLDDLTRAQTADVLIDMIGQWADQPAPKKAVNRPPGALVDDRRRDR